MTFEEVQKLIDNELRVKVAELCGWKHSVFGNMPWQMIPPNGDGSKVESCPHYCDDLNAMHEEEKAFYDVKLTVLAVKYINNLMKVTGLPCDSLDSFRLLHATARQRAEAFVLTLTRKED